jgi:hypothetical protein
MVFVRYVRFAADKVLPRHALHFSQNLFKRHNNTFLSFNGSLEFAFFQISSNFSAVLCTITLRSFSPSNSSFENYLATSPYVGKSAVGRSAGLTPNIVFSKKARVVLGLVPFTLGIVLLIIYHLG